MKDKWRLISLVWPSNEASLIDKNLIVRCLEKRFTDWTSPIFSRKYHNISSSNTPIIWWNDGWALALLPSANCSKIIEWSIGGSSVVVGRRARFVHFCKALVPFQFIVCCSTSHHHSSLFLLRSSSSKNEKSWWWWCTSTSAERSCQLIPIRMSHLRCNSTQLASPHFYLFQLIKHNLSDEDIWKSLHRVIIHFTESFHKWLQSMRLSRSNETVRHSGRRNTFRHFIKINPCTALR